MKKTIVLIITLFVFVNIIGIAKVNAGAICTEKDLNELKMKAYNVSLSYKIKKTKEGVHYYEITITNLQDGFVAKGSGVTIYGDGEVKIAERLLTDNLNFEIDLYAGPYTACKNQKIYTKKLTLPRYNIFSEREECIEYEEFPLCNPWYKEKVTEFTFETELQKYINSLKKVEEEKSTKEKSTIEKIIDFYIENKIITIPITIAVVGGITVIIINKIKRRKSRVKIDF